MTLTSVAISVDLHRVITQDLEKQESGKIRYGETRRRLEHLLKLGLAEEKRLQESKTK